MTAAPTTGPWFRRFVPRTADTEATAAPRARLVCFPHAGGAASYFSALAARLRPAFDVLAVQYPGRQERRRERCASSLVELAEGVVERIAETEQDADDLPMVLFGHSMGATVAYEVARRLEHDDDRPVARLVVSARNAPSQHLSAGIRHLDDAGVLAELRRIGGTDEGLLADPEMLQLLLPTLRADYTAAETYRHVPGPELSCPIDALCGDADSRLRPGDLAGWSTHTTGAFSLQTVAGDHFYLGADPGPVEALLRARLDRFGA